MNNLTIVGNLGKDAVKAHVNGRWVLNFSVAVSKTWTDAQGQKQEQTTWFDCAKWSNEDPKVGEYLKKGTTVAVVGEVSARLYDKQDGTKGLSITLDVAYLKLCGGTQVAPATQPWQQQPPAAAPTTTAPAAAPQYTPPPPPQQQQPTAPQPPAPPVQQPTYPGYLWNGTAWVPDPNYNPAAPPAPPAPPAGPSSLPPNAIF